MLALHIGQSLAALLNEKILIIGSDNLTHNLREVFRGNHVETLPWVCFGVWVADKVDGRAGNGRV